MAFEIQTNWTSLVGDQSTVTFKNNIYQYLVGISAFALAYADGTDHHVEQASISLNVSQAQPDTLTISATGILTDADGHQLDPSQSHLYITAVAWTGAPPTGLLLSAPAIVGNGEASQPIPLPGASEAILQAGLTGFTLAYAGTDHHVEFVQASVSPSSTGYSGFINATVNMYDASGNQANAPTAGGVLLASNSSNPGLVVQPYSSQNADGNTIQMPQAISQAVVLLTGFQASYADDEDHHVERIGAGPSSVQVDSTDATKVLTNGVWAFMNDASGNSQDNSKSKCNLIVIGIPA